MFYTPLARASSAPVRTNPARLITTLPGLMNHSCYYYRHITSHWLQRCITTTSTTYKSSSNSSNNLLPPRPKIAESETTKKSLKGSGPGGQKINKTNSAIQLRHTRTGIVVKCQATRSRAQNEKIARRILAEKVELLEKGGESRVARQTERKSRKKRSADKKRRRKYRKLAEEKNQEGGGTVGRVQGRDGLEEDEDDDEEVVVMGEDGIDGEYEQDQTVEVLNDDEIEVQDIDDEGDLHDSRFKGTGKHS